MDQTVPESVVVAAAASPTSEDSEPSFDYNNQIAATIVTSPFSDSDKTEFNESARTDISTEHEDAEAAAEQPNMLNQSVESGVHELEPLAGDVGANEIVATTEESPLSPVSQPASPHTADIDERVVRVTLSEKARSAELLAETIMEVSLGLEAGVEEKILDKEKVYSKCQLFSSTPSPKNGEKEEEKTTLSSTETNQGGRKMSVCRGRNQGGDREEEVILVKIVSREDTCGFKTPWIKRQNLRDVPMDVCPETPRRRLYRGLKRAKVTCVCDAMNSEHEWNSETATVFHNQLKHTEFHAMRRELKLGDTVLGCEFVVGKSTHLKICLLKDKDLSIDDKVILIIISGLNEIRVPALKFVEKAMPAITQQFLTPCSGHPEDDMKLPELDVYAEVYADAFTKWMVLREYIRGYVAEKIHISVHTWVEFKRLSNLIHGVATYYTDLVLQDRDKAMEVKNLSCDSSPTSWRQQFMQDDDDEEEVSFEST
jgi:hypothetical protein